MEIDEFSRPLALGDDEDYCENEVKRPSKLSPSRDSANVSKGRKCAYDARENQQRYLTRSKYNAEKMAEKSVLIIPNPKETDTDKFSRPLALGDDESYSEAEVKGLANLSPSPVNAKVSKGQKCDYNARDNQQRYPSRSKLNAEKGTEKSILISPNLKEAETDKVSKPLALGENEDYSEDAGNGAAKLSPSLVSAKVSRGKKRDYDARHIQQRYPTRNKLNAEKVTEKSILISPNSKETETDKVSQPLASGDDEDYSEDAVNGAAKLSPSLVSAKVSRGKKRDYDARHIQQRYPTRSKLNAEKVTEKSILMSPNPKETGTDKVSQPLALGDDEDNCEDAVNGAAKLSPSLVSAKVSRGKKGDYDARHIQQRYPMRNKLNAEKVTEKPILISPNLKETKTDKVSQPLAPGDDEDYSEDAVNGAAKLSPSLVSAKVSRGMKRDYDARHIQQRYPTRSKLNAEKVTEKSIFISPNPKNMETDEFSRPLACEDDEDTEVVKAAAKLSPSWVSENLIKGKKRGYDAQESAEKLAQKSVQIIPDPKEAETDKFSRPLALGDDEDYSADEEHDTELRPRSRHCDITISPFVVCSSGEEGARTKVRETLKLFHVLVRKILQGEETNSIEKGTGKRVHMRVANILKEKGIYINTEKVIGAVPGVAIGDIYSYRLELAIIGLHTSLLNGIDTVKQEKLYVATSVVASEGYNNDVGNSDILIYTGEDRNPMGVDKHPEDQKLERGNLALKNCIDKKSPVRVIRFKEAKPSDTDDERHKMVGIYTYDGLYTVERYWPERGPHGKLVYKFELIRMPGQRQLAFKGVKQSKSRKVREGHCVYDISNGKEKLPIGAVNTVNDEKPPPFTYISSTMYPNWCQPLPPKGCDCKGGCSDSNLCACAVKNGGDIPYNRKGAIVEAKPLVYECGPSCKCPPSCPNRVSQRGIKLPLEIFKTESMGWGVRCRSYIPSGSFICEYIGELLDDKEAEERVGSDEYLFDVGKNYNDTTLSDELSELMPNMPSINAVENIGFTIDAALYGNIGRFVNHSCSPNLYAQNVLYDHEDERIPHVMLFATENIPPLQELTYHYNYTIDQVFDSKGNIKKKSCYCGSDECTGRMY
ncbi:hypothetical protein RND81_09G051200 [Saponaria officinalis]|uniref:Uncharacterized protein n=1 Tax=Saponaria officinalis TaxID=3572 RepID=A0AAW1IIP4_SAPOF